MVSRLRSIVSPRGRFGRSLFYSSTFHATLIGFGLALPVLWTGTRVARPPVTIWVSNGGAPPELFEDPVEPPLEVELEPLAYDEPEVTPLPVEPEPFPELPLPEPPEAVELLADELRRPPLEPVFAPPGAEPELEALADADSVPQSEPPEVETSSEPPTEPLTPAPVEVPPRVLAEHCPRPAYPARALRLGWQGTVVCSLAVASDGSVRDVRLLESSGHGLLDETVLRTLRTWRFAPGTLDGVPTRMELVRRFRFELPS